MTTHMHTHTLLGTLGGTLITIFTLHSEDIVKTACLASIGAVVSFVVSLACRKVYNYIKSKFNK